MPPGAASVPSDAVSDEQPRSPDVSDVSAAPRRIPEATVLRLPIYQRILAELVRAGSSTVSSEQLAELARVNAAKVRKDLSLLGSFGTRGSGYVPEFLIAQIDRTLGVDENWSVAIVGIGNLGRALTNSAGFASRGCQVTSLYDVDAAVVGEEIRGMRVRHMDELAQLRVADRPDIGVITTPGWAAQPGVVITPMSGHSAARRVAISSMWRTRMPRISSPTTSGSTSKSDVTWQPREAKAAELVRARPRLPMPTMATDQSSSTPSA